MFGWDPWALEPGFPHRRVLRAGTVITAVLGGGFVGVVLLLVLRIPDLPAPAMAVGVVLALGSGCSWPGGSCAAPGKGPSSSGPRRGSSLGQCLPGSPMPER